MVVCASPLDRYFSETLSTLQFAQRAKRIKNRAVANENTSGSTAALQEEIARLRAQLAARPETPPQRTGGGEAPATAQPAAVTSDNDTGMFGNRQLLLAAIAEKQSLVAERDAAVAAQAGYAKAMGAKEKQVTSLRMQLKFARDSRKGVAGEAPPAA